LRPVKALSPEMDPGAPGLKERKFGFFDRRRIWLYSEGWVWGQDLTACGGFLRIPRGAGATD